MSSRTPCPNCGSTEWTLRVGLGMRPSDTRPPVNVCNVCSPGKSRPTPRWWKKRTTVNVWLLRCLWLSIYLNAFAAVIRLARHFA